MSLVEGGIIQIENKKALELANNNEIAWYSARIRKVNGQSDIGYDYVAMFCNIFKRKQDEETIKRMAYYDGLTGLYNRTMFMDYLTSFISYSKDNNNKFAVIFIDLNNFKKINDSRGHYVGDIVLKEISSRLKK